TTLLSVLLNNHPEVFLDERAIAIRTLDFRQRLEQARGHRPDASWPEVCRAAVRTDERLREFLHWPILEKNPDQSLADFVTNSFTHRADGRLFGDKSPDAIARLPELLSLFPNAKILHLIRDPRPNVRSLVRRQYLPLAVAAQRWKDWNLAGLTAARWQGPDRILRLRYEDLLTEPEKTLKQVCVFLDIPFLPDMLALDQSAATQTKGAYVKAHLDTAALTAWENELSTRDRAQIERICGDLMRELGYEPTTATAGNADLSYFRDYRLRVANAFRLLFKPRLQRMIDRKLVDVPQSLGFRFYQLFATILRGIFSDRLIDALLGKGKKS
ncbi:MAG: sulfotransferase, partial [Bacteroidota bacterium]